MDDRHQNELKHECELPMEDYITTKFIATGYCVSMRRKFRGWMIASTSSARSRFYLRSTFIINREQVNNLLHHYYMIHPFSVFRALWEAIIIVIIFLLLILVPICNIIHLELLETLLDMTLYTLYIDIILTFNTGYLDSVSNCVVMDRKTVTINYLTHWFLFDVISTLELHYIDHPIIKTGVFKYVLALRIFTLFRYINNFRENKQIGMKTMKIAKISILIGLILLWMLSIMVVSEAIRTKSTSLGSYAILFSLKKVIYMMLLYGIYDIEKPSLITSVQLICILAGFFLTLLITCQFLQIYIKYSWSDQKYLQMTQQLHEFMRYKRLPANLRTRITKYCDYRFDMNFYKEADIMKILSPQLRQEMMLQAHVSLLEKVAIFENMPMAIICRLIYDMKIMIYLPSDVVISAGSVGDAMYFLASGSMAVYTVTGKELSHLSDGDTFGDISLVMENQHRTVTVIAIECCEVYVLYRSDFVKQLEPYPELFQRIKFIATNILDNNYQTNNVII